MQRMLVEVDADKLTEMQEEERKSHVTQAKESAVTSVHTRLSGYHEQLAKRLTEEFLADEDGAGASLLEEQAHESIVNGNLKKFQSSLSQSEVLTNMYGSERAGDEYDNVQTERYVVEADELGIDGATLQRNSGFMIKVEKTRQSGKIPTDYIEKQERTRTIRRSLDQMEV